MDSELRNRNSTRVEKMHILLRMGNDRLVRVMALAGDPDAAAIMPAERSIRWRELFELTWSISPETLKEAVKLALSKRRFSGNLLSKKEVLIRRNFVASNATDAQSYNRFIIAIDGVSYAPRFKEIQRELKKLIKEWL